MCLWAESGRERGCTFIRSVSSKPIDFYWLVVMATHKKASVFWCQESADSEMCVIQYPKMDTDLDILGRRTDGVTCESHYDLVMTHQDASLALCEFKRSSPTVRSSMRLFLTFFDLLLTHKKERANESIHIITIQTISQHQYNNTTLPTNKENGHHRSRSPTSPLSRRIRRHPPRPGDGGGLLPHRPQSRHGQQGVDGAAGESGRLDEGRCYFGEGAESAVEVFWVAGFG